MFSLSVFPLFTRFQRLRRGIILRLLMFALTLAFFGFIGRYIMLERLLTKDVGALSAAHQMSIAEYAARDVEQKVSSRLTMLSNLALQLPRDTLAQPDELGRWLAARVTTRTFFSEGLMVVRAEDSVTMGSLVPPNRHFAVEGSDWLAQTIATRAPYISRPFRLSSSGEPAMALTAPIQDQDGRVVAVLAGITLLNSENFLGLLAEKKVGNSGSFLLVSPRDGLIITAGDPEKILQPLPPPGRNPLHDQAMAGFRGTGYTTDQKGGEELSAIASVPTPGWFLVARVPVSEALKPVDNILSVVRKTSVVVMATMLLILIVALPRLFRPLTQAAQQLNEMAAGRQELRPLPVHSHDEVGEVAQGFNYLLGVLREKEEALRRSEARMSHLAHHDMLTGLPNRTLFEDRLNQALMRAQRHHQGFAILYVDLDGFKPINDRYGHPVGDLMLRHVADALAQMVRKSDTVARIGGDEFALLLCELDDPAAAAERVALQCRAAICRPMAHDGVALHVDASIGIACHPRDGKSPGELLRHADHDMYAIKNNRKAG